MARADALTSCMQEEGAEVLAVQIAGSTSVYPWSLSSKAPFRLFCLFEGRDDVNLGFTETFWAAFSFMRHHNVDAVAVPSYWPASSLAIIAASFLCNCRLVIMTDSYNETGSKSWYTRYAKSFLLSLADSVFVAGTPHFWSMRELGVPSSRLRIGYDCVDNAYFEDRSGMRPQWSSRLPRHFFLSLGRLIQKKNLRLVIKAFRIACSKGAGGVRNLVFVGEGPERESLIEFAEEMGLTVVKDGTVIDCSKVDGAVIFYPFVSSSDAAVFYGLADAFVLASPIEEWGLVVNEAMACSCLVLVSSTAGCAADLVDDGKTGFAFDPNDSESLANLFLAVHESNHKLDAVRRNGRARVDSFSLKQFSRSLSDLALLPKSVVI